MTTTTTTTTTTPARGTLGTIVVRYPDSSYVTRTYEADGSGGGVPLGQHPSTVSEQVAAYLAGTVVDAEVQS